MTLQITGLYDRLLDTFDNIVRYKKKTVKKTGFLVNFTSGIIFSWRVFIANFTLSVRVYKREYHPLEVFIE